MTFNLNKKKNKKNKIIHLTLKFESKQSKQRPERNRDRSIMLYIDLSTNTSEKYTYCKISNQLAVLSNKTTTKDKKETPNDLI